MYIYFSSFNINIFSYVGFSEILTTFIGNSGSIFGFLLIYLIHIFLSVFTVDTGVQAIERHQGPTAFNQVEVNNGLSIIANISTILHLLVCGVLVFLLTTGRLTPNLFLLYYFTFVTMNFIGVLLDLMENTLVRLINERFYNLSLLLLGTVLPFVFYSCSFAYYNVWLKTTHREKIIMVDQNNDTLLEYSNLNYIGKTNNYVFLYNPTTDESTVVSLNNIKTLKCK